MIFSYLLNMQSHPSWVCGLKLAEPEALPKLRVTPFVGVWIETSTNNADDDQLYVTPFVGVWIETNQKAYHSIQLGVTPFVGVWIETE